MANRSEMLSPIAPAWAPLSPEFGPATMRFEMAWVYSCPITDMS